MSDIKSSLFHSSCSIPLSSINECPPLNSLDPSGLRMGQRSNQLPRELGKPSSCLRQPVLKQPRREGSDHSISNTTSPLRPEREDDNIEYKRHLTDITDEKFSSLASQLKNRLINGSGECIYKIGVEDDGTISGIDIEQTNESLTNLAKLCDFVKANICSKYSIPVKDIDGILDKYCLNDGDIYTRVVIRNNSLEFPIDISVAALGHVDSGKSSLLGTLLTGELDDGDGYTRRFVTNHQHEEKRTSSVGFHLTGFQSDGSMITSSEIKRDRAWKEITTKSKKIVSFIDLCGHSGYFKTTISGITGVKPDYAMMLVESTKGIQGLPQHLGMKSGSIRNDNRFEKRGQKQGSIGMTVEHMGLCRDQNVPFFMLITKYDLGLTKPKIFESTIRTVRGVIKNGLGKNPFEIKNEDDVYKAIDSFKISPSGSYSTIPYMLISSKTGHNIDLLRKFLNLLPKRSRPEGQAFEQLKDKQLISSCIEKFNVPGTGTVIHTFINQGTLFTGQKVWLGPDSVGDYKQSVVKTIEYKRNRVDRIPCGRLATVCLRDIRYEHFSRGMVILDHKPSLLAVKQFKADVYIKEHSTTIKLGYECPLHIDNIRQPVKVIDIFDEYGNDLLDDNGIKIKNRDKHVLPGSKGVLIFEMICRPVFVNVGTKFLFRESNTKGSGVISEIYKIGNPYIGNPN